MSRTLKDRPHWVAENDKKNARRVAFHAHEKAGEPVYRRERAVDEDGNPALHTYTVSEVAGYRYRVNGSYKQYETFGELLEDNPDDAEFLRLNARRGQFQVTRQAERKVPVYTMVLAGYRPTECTIDSPTPRENYYWENDATHLCYHEIERWKNQGCGCCGTDRPTKKERSTYHRENRSRENSAVHNLKKEANAGYDYEGGVYEDVFNKRQRFHLGYWD